MGHSVDEVVVHDHLTCEFPSDLDLQIMLQLLGFSVIEVKLVDGSVFLSAGHERSGLLGDILVVVIEIGAVVSGAAAAVVILRAGLLRLRLGRGEDSHAQLRIPGVSLLCDLAVLVSVFCGVVLFFSEVNE